MGEDPNYHGGGAISNNTDPLEIIRCAFNGNQAALIGLGGAIYSGKSGDAQVVNSTFFANGVTPAGQGGAIYNADNGSASKIEYRLYNVTFTDNTAGEGGAIYNDNETVELYNTIIDEGDLGVGGTCAGAEPVDGGGNMQSSGTACGATIPDVTDMDLGEPTFNGGPIVSLLTIMPNSGSPAIDAADNSVCAAPPVNNEDQRGESRPNDGDGDGDPVCDVGAMEREAAVAGYGSDPVQPGPIQFGSTISGTTISASFEVFETGNTTLNVTSPSLSGAHAGDFVSPSGFSIADGGSPVDVTLDCTPTDVGTRTATLSLNTNDPNWPTVDYELLCIGTGTPEPGYGSTPPAPGPIDFGEVEVGTSRQRSFSVFESGTADLTVQNPTLGGANPGIFNLLTVFPFTISNDGPAVDVDLTCEPTEPGIQTALLTLETNDPNNPTVSYDLNCDGYISPGPPIVPGPIITVSTPYDVAISPDGNHLYVTNQSQSRLMVYERDEAGDLTLIQQYTDADLGAPYGVAVSPDGKQVFVTSMSQDAFHILDRDSESGQVSSVDVIHDGDLIRCSPEPPHLCLYADGLDDPDGIAVSPDGRSIYVASQSDDAISIFSRELPTGTVTYTYRLKEGVGSTVGLRWAQDVAVSPDGNHVYVAASNSNIADSDGALTLFSRDPESGWLTFVTSYADGDGLLLGGASGVAVNPDGGQVYVAATGDDAMLTFTRNPADGSLSLRAAWFDSFIFNGLGGAHGLATSPDGSMIYVSTIEDNSFLAFERDPVDGFIYYPEIYWDGVDGVDGLWFATRVAASLDNKHVYVTGYLDNAIARFDVAKPVPVLTSLDPASATAGDPDFVLTVFGQRFSTDSVVQWDGSDRETTFVSSTELQAQITAADVAAVGTTEVQVYTPPPGGGTSNMLRFPIGDPGDNPVPALRSLDPAGAMAGSPALTLTVNGSNFISDTIVQWNGDERETTFITDTQLQAVILTSDLAVPGTAGVTAFNPGPGGGTSNALSFEIAGPGENPVPSIERISPSKVQQTGAGGSDLTVTVYGDNLIPESEVHLEGEFRVTDYIDANRLQATFNAGDTAYPGVYAVTVFNPEPGGGTSNSVNFSVVTETVTQCVEISAVDLVVLNSGSVVVEDTVDLQVDISPDDFGTPYNYTIDYGDGSDPVSGSSSDDPFTSSYTYAASGTYTITFSAWNCDMIELAIGIIEVPVYPLGSRIYLPIVVRGG